MGSKYDNEFMHTGKEVNEIANELRAKNKKNNEKKNGKKKLIILLLLLLVFVGAGVAVGVLMFTNTRMNMDFLTKNVDAGVKVWCNILDTKTSVVEEVLVDGKTEAYLSFAPEEAGKDGTLNKQLAFSNNSTLTEDSILQFFYEIENRSDVADMYVNYSKEKGNDTNFMISVYYKVGTNEEVVALTYYAFEGSYYLSEEDIINGTNALDSIELTEAIKLEKNAKMTMRIEMQVYDLKKDARCNCNFVISLINDIYYTSGVQA